MRNLYLSNQPVSYRIDLYRALSRELDCEICFQEAAEDISGVPVRRWTLRALPALLKELRPSVVFVPEFSAAALLMLSLRKKYGFKVISSCDDSMDMILGNDFGWKHRLARGRVPRRLDNIILHSPAVRDWYRSRFGKGVFMPIIADEERVRPALEAALSLSERLRPSGKPLVAFVGRLVGLKNVPTLIRSFEPLQERARLVIIGDGPERETLRAMAPKALFTGMLSGEELLAWYNLIDVLVLPSTQEAYGAVTGEALMAGAKVVVSRKAGSSDLVREGENGYAVDPMDADALTACIGSLLEQVPENRPLTLRDSQSPYSFQPCIQELIQEIKSL